MPFGEVAQPVQSVPSSASQSQGSGLDISSIIKNTVTPIPDSVIQRAYSPVPGAHAATLPSNLTTPVPPHQNKPMDDREVVGAGNARMRGIKNAFTGAANALGTVMTKEAQIKQNGIRDAATKVIMAQQGIDEAKQALANAHAAGDTEGVQKATQMIQQNQQARDAVFADPKMRKALSKGFDISYTDPESNKTEEHAAVQEALRQAKTFAEKKVIMQAQQQKQNQAAGQAAGAAYEKAQPQAMGPNVQAQQELAARQQQQKNQIESVRAMAPYFAAQARAGAALSVEQMRGAVNLRTHAIDAERDIEKMTTTMKMHEEDRAAAKNLEAFRLAVEHQNRLSEQGSPIEIMKAFQSSGDNYVKNLNESQQRRQALNTELDKGPSHSREIEIRRQLSTLDTQDTAAKNLFEAGKNFAIKQSGLDPKQFEIQVPVPKVAEGVSNATSGSSKSDSPDLDPRTGKPFKSSVSTTDRLLVKSLAGVSGVYHSGANIIGGISKSLEGAERSLERDDSDGN